ncbi:MAG: hypothetical protein NC084_05820 [Bacteroides sp.]|nr:hypothetical protein [Eubacterium sp.]MCM1418072.1 hypothetical protein [Roseburia sp.]MCM1462216.1 hypothetical protein [Bacteroides sp.]
MNRSPNTRLEMIVSIIAFLCNLVLVGVLVAIGRDSYESPGSFAALITLLTLSTLAFFLAPILVKISVYQSFRRPDGFSASYAIREYHLEGRLRGKYYFLDAIFNRVNGDFDEAIRNYERCLAVANDPRMRRACYLDMARHLHNYIVLIPHFIRATKEFPNETVFIGVVSSYYLYCSSADRDEGEKWFEFVMGLEGEQFRDCRELAYYRFGLIRMYEKRYAEAIGLFRRIDLLRKDGLNHCILVNLALCCACVGDFDGAREAAVHALTLVDDKEEFETIREIVEYMFHAKTEGINPEVEKLAEELARRDEARETAPLSAYRSIAS